MIKPLFVENGIVSIIDQTLLPQEYKIIEINDHIQMAEAIKRLAIRGAPAIGIAAAYGLVLGLKDYQNSSIFFKKLDEISEMLNATRPTAVNLSWALGEMKKTAEANKTLSAIEIWQKLWDKAGKIHEDDIQRCINIGKNGNNIIHQNAKVLTHCNAGGLATGGLGTALAVIITAHKSGKNIKVYADETRPLLQGARLTAWELGKVNIPHEICTDNTAGFLMQKGEVDVIVVGADRIALNGDAANKIGTYSLAVMAKYHGIPMYIAAPNSTIDTNIKSGDEIPIEFRSDKEVKFIGETQIAPINSNAVTPAFDVTPAELITGIITEEKVYNYPYNFCHLKN